MMELTEEQKTIVRCDLEPGEILRVMAFAGTGKTTTLAAYATARPRTRFLYVAFNKSVQLEAAQKFPANVLCRTSHALAFRTHGYKHKERLVSGFRANTVREALNLENYETARFAIDTLCNYLVSEAPRVSLRHVPFQAKVFYEQKRATVPDFVGLANRLGRMMCDGTDERIGMLHDGYLKLYQLSEPKLNFDCILLDEAQDINPVTSAVILAQAQAGRAGKAASIILVGDSHQQIYSFRGARDTLTKIRATKTLFLTQSFRFDNNVARVANMVLGTFKGEKKKIVGTPVQREAKPKWNPKRHTIIARTHAALFDKAVALCGTRRIGFVGGVQGYRLDAIRDVYFLFAERRDRIMDAYIQSFYRYRDLKMYAEAVEDLELLGICRVVENHRWKIPGHIRMIRENAVDAAGAEIVLTTAHKSKGLEWENVQLAGDFPKLAANGELADLRNWIPMGSTWFMWPCRGPCRSCAVR